MSLARAESQHAVTEADRPEFPAELYEIKHISLADPIDGNQGFCVRGARLTLSDATTSTEYALYKHERRREPIQVFYEQRPEWLPGRGRYYRFPFGSTLRPMGKAIHLDLPSELPDEDELRGRF